MPQRPCCPSGADPTEHGVIIFLVWVSRLEVALTTQPHLQPQYSFELSPVRILESYREKGVHGVCSLVK